MASRTSPPRATFVRHSPSGAALGVQRVFGVDEPRAAAVGADGGLEDGPVAEPVPLGVEPVTGEREEGVGNGDPRRGQFGRRGVLVDRRGDGVGVVQHRHEPGDGGGQAQPLGGLFVVREEEPVRDHVDAWLEGRAAARDVDSRVLGPEPLRPRAQCLGGVEDCLRLLAVVQAQDADRRLSDTHVVHVPVIGQRRGARSSALGGPLGDGASPRELASDGPVRGVL